MGATAGIRCDGTTLTAIAPEKTQRIAWPKVNG